MKYLLIVICIASALYFTPIRKMRQITLFEMWRGVKQWASKLHKVAGYVALAILGLMALRIVYLLVSRLLMGR